MDGREHGTAWHVDNLVAILKVAKRGPLHDARTLRYPFSFYCQKALIPFYEHDIPFTYRMMEEPGVVDELASLWPIRKFSLLRDDGCVILETTIIIEHLPVR
jgi:hypothetical protein